MKDKFIRKILRIIFHIHWLDNWLNKYDWYKHLLYIQAHKILDNK